MTATDVLDLYGFDRRPELGKICRYIQRTDKGRLSKDMYSDDLRALYLLGLESVCESIILSFYFGQAKGFRACDEKRRKLRDITPMLLCALRLLECSLRMGKQMVLKFFD